MQALVSKKTLWAPSTAWSRLATSNLLFRLSRPTPARAFLGKKPTGVLRIRKEVGESASKRLGDLFRPFEQEHQTVVYDLDEQSISAAPTGAAQRSCGQIDSPPAADGDVAKQFPHLLALLPGAICHAFSPICMARRYFSRQQAAHACTAPGRCSRRWSQTTDARQTDAGIFQG